MEVSVVTRDTVMTCIIVTPMFRFVWTVSSPVSTRRAEEPADWRWVMCGHVTCLMCHECLA